MKWIKFNTNDLKSIKDAERRKAKLENEGYSLKHEFVNSITGDCTLTYDIPATGHLVRPDGTINRHIQ